MRRGSRVPAVVAVLLAVAIGGSAARAQGRIRVGEEVPYQAGTVAYPVGGTDRPVSWSETIVSPGATFLRVHFSKLNLPSGDYLTVAAPGGGERWTYTGRGPRGSGELWSFSVDGDTAVVELHSAVRAGRNKRFGVEIDRIARGDVPLGEDGFPLDKVICGTDGREDVACHTSVDVRPVARLTFQSGGTSFVCTGWLVAGANDSTMMTNNHCVDDQTEVSTVQARFNYQRTTCGGSTTEATLSSFAGGTFLRTSVGLDYTLLTLLGNPEATWGEYTATIKSPTVGMTINFIQHPDGGVKRIGWWDDSAHTLRCNVATVNATYGGSPANSQIGYSCDSEGGSSGSPIMDAGTGRIIGLHHFGGVTSNPCLNAATQFNNICHHARTLIACAAD